MYFFFVKLRYVYMYLFYLLQKDFWYEKLLLQLIKLQNSYIKLVTDNYRKYEY